MWETDFTYCSLVRKTVGNCSLFFIMNDSQITIQICNLLQFPYCPHNTGLMAKNSHKITKYMPITYQKYKTITFRISYYVMLSLLAQQLLYRSLFHSQELSHLQTINWDLFKYYSDMTTFSFHLAIPEYMVKLIFNVILKSGWTISYIKCIHTLQCVPMSQQSHPIQDYKHFGTIAALQDLHIWILW